MAKARKPPRIDPTKFLPAEAYFAPRVVRSGTVGHQPERQRQINAGVAAIKALRSERRNERLIQGAQSQLSKEVSMKDAADAEISGGSGNTVPAVDDAEASAALKREIRQTQSSWLRASQWVELCDEKTRDDLLELIALQVRGGLAPGEFTKAMRESRNAVIGTTPLRDDNYYHPRACPWKMPGGW